MTTRTKIAERHSTLAAQVTGQPSVVSFVPGLLAQVLSLRYSLDLLCGRIPTPSPWALRISAGKIKVSDGDLDTHFSLAVCHCLIGAPDRTFVFLGSLDVANRHDRFYRTSNMS